MNLECAICCNLITEEPDVPSAPLPEKRQRENSGSVPGSSSGMSKSRSPELCVPRCGHLFHKSCLSNWTSRTKTCPSCRKTVEPSEFTKVYLPVVNQDAKNCGNCSKLAEEKEQFKKLKAEIEEKFFTEEGKVDRLEQVIVDANQREVAQNARFEEVERSQIEAEMKVLQERRKVDKIQGKMDELEQRHLLLIGDFEEMNKKYQTEHENVNVLEGKVASLEAQFQQQETKNDDYVNEDSDSDIEIIQG